MDGSISVPKAGGKPSGKQEARRAKAEGGPRLVVTIAGERREIDPAMLSDETFADKLQQECEQADQPVVFRLGKLLDLTDEQRWCVLDFIASLGRRSFEVAKTIYAVVQGKGKGRGSVKGIAPQDYCVTVMITSGEQPATSFTQDGGTRARVLTLWGTPFGSTTPQVGTVVRRLNRRLVAHHGHAGPRFVRFLIEKRAAWGSWRRLYIAWVRHYEELAGDDTIAMRMASHFAAIHVTSRFVHEALALPWPWAGPIEPLWDELTRESGEADRAAAALRHVMSWAFAHREDFYHLSKTTSEHPHAGWAGRWDVPITVAPGPGGRVAWGWIGFMPHVLERLLKDAGFDPISTIRTWKDRDWLRTDGASAGTVRNQYSTQVGTEVARVYAVTRAAVEAVTNG